MSSRATPRPVTRALGQIGDDLRTWRLLQRLTAEQVADRAGVNVKTVSSLENGHGANLENTLRVLRALGLLDRVREALDPYESDIGRLRAGEALPERIRHSAGRT